VITAYGKAVNAERSILKRRLYFNFAVVEPMIKPAIKKGMIRER
jgi:hypothetical protein